MRTKIISTLTTLLTFILNLITALIWHFTQGWRWWVGGAVLGLLLATGYAWLQPPLYRSEGTLTLTPRFVLEGYVLATEELTHHYAVRIVGDEPLARAMRSTGATELPEVSAEGQPGMMVLLTVLHPDPAIAEAFNRALLIDLAEQIRFENRTRGENDRLFIDISPTGFARPAAPAWGYYSAAGAAVGFVAGTLLLYLLAWWQHGRIRTPQQAKLQSELPLLGLIPHHRP